MDCEGRGLGVVDNIVTIVNIVNNNNNNIFIIVIIFNQEGVNPASEALEVDVLEGA